MDVVRFQRLVDAGRVRLHDRPEEAAALLDDALGLWRGPAYAEFADEEFARGEAARLEELRLEALADRVDAALVLGRHTEVIGRLESVAAEHPLRERPRVQLMLALHRIGRSPDALASFREHRELLAEELGLDPSPGLRDLEAAIIRQDSALASPAAVARPDELLDPAERRVFERLSVFAGPLTLDAAAQVAGGEEVDPLQVADIVAGLVDKSLIFASTDPPPTRFTMLETLRAYGWERLGEWGETATACRSHARYHVGVAEAAATGLRGPDEASWADNLAGLLDDLRSAHRWAIDHDPGLALRMSAGLFWYVETGAPSEVVTWAEHVDAPEPAAALYGALTVSSTAVQAFGADAERLAAGRTRLREVLGADRFCAAEVRGAAMDDDQAVVFAVEVLDGLAAPGL